jgi:hypothetical protein
MAYIYLIPIATASEFWLEPLTAGIYREFGMHAKYAKRVNKHIEQANCENCDYEGREHPSQVVCPSPW